MTSVQECRQRRAAVGDLVRDTVRDCQAVLTDVRADVPYLRPRHGGGLVDPWPTTWAAVEMVARRGTWEDA
ncbi:hypothetical protein EASAB2608_02122 [Streptomyces sp. EAS-AB2608]|uniref:hypothetical protein n=1 Tax=Streptomyces sp. EAS-AB2608 TaxID=2779671 RepID=UPI001BF08BEB|nr:hypothetical protein [Streptomyces sp. EAS-AB2608]BCM66788.1 hypothetical protein EASAB2608_02122 [Streptomyces sp. EAS-AB2608]